MKVKIRIQSELLIQYRTYTILECIFVTIVHVSNNAEVTLKKRTKLLKKILFGSKPLKLLYFMQLKYYKRLASKKIFLSYDFRMTFEPY